MRMRAGPASALAVGMGLCLCAQAASAGNGTKPRIPVDWTDTPCMTIVDRSVSADLHLDYSISMEDTDLTSDEVEDSRTHQFFAFCQAHDPQNFLPRWITQSDIDRAAMVGAAPDNVDPEDIMESSSLWSGCFTRINADDDRYPITFAAAMAGVDWDASAVPAGAYIVEGYTWEPPINVWSKRPGVIKVVDDPDLAQSGPALAVTNTEEVINKNEPVLIEGCVSAMAGSTLTAYWGQAEPEVDWVSFIANEPVTGDAFALEFLPPEEIAGDSALIRVDVADPMGRSYTNYMSELVIVLGTDGPGSCTEEGGFIGGADCADSGSDGSSATNGTDSDAEPTSSGTAGSASDTTPGMDGGDGAGPKACACRSTNPAGSLWTGVLILGLLGLRRRRAA